MDNRQSRQAAGNRQYRSTTIRRTLDGSIDFRFYERRAHILRAEAAWDIVGHMSQVLPFFREGPASSTDRPNCTML